MATSLAEREGNVKEYTSETPRTDKADLPDWLSPEDAEKMRTLFDANDKDSSTEQLTDDVDLSSIDLKLEDEAESESPLPVEAAHHLGGAAMHSQATQDGIITEPIAVPNAKPPKKRFHTMAEPDDMDPDEPSVRPDDIALPSEGLQQVRVDLTKSTEHVEETERDQEGVVRDEIDWQETSEEFKPVRAITDNLGRETIHEPLAALDLTFEQDDERETEDVFRAKGLALLSDEIHALSEKSDSEKDAPIKAFDLTFEEVPVREAKQQVFDDLLALYSERGIDLSFLDGKETALPSPALTALQARDETAPEAKPEPITPIEIEPVDDVLAQPIIEAINKDEDEASAESDVESEPGKLEKLKNWFGKELSKLQEFHGAAYFSGKWHDAKDWLINRHTNDDMTEFEVHLQKQKNRRNNVLGTTAVVVAGGVVAAGLSIWAGINVSEQAATMDLPSGGGGGDAGGALEPVVEPPVTESPPEAEALPEVSVEPVVPEAIPEVAPEPVVNISNPAYEIPSGGEGLKLFEKLGLSADIWNDNAHALVEQFPNEFYAEGNDVRILNPGWLSEDARRFIESLRNGA